jgi:hypothetical protein
LSNRTLFTFPPSIYSHSKKARKAGYSLAATFSQTSLTPRIMKVPKTSLALKRKL